MLRILAICLISLFFCGSLSAQEPRSPVEMELQKNDPQAYKERKEFLGKQSKITVIVDAFRKGQISRYSAENQLTPLIKDQIEAEISDLESKIASLGKELEALKEARNNPDPLVKKRIDQILIKSGLAAGELNKQ